MLAIAGLIVIAFCLVALPARVWAAPEEAGNQAITIEAYSLLANWTKPGTWLPLAVEVTNRGPDFSGQIRIPYAQNRPDHGLHSPAVAGHSSGTATGSGTGKRPR